jgi:hypothetical protein
MQSSLVGVDIGGCVSHLASSLCGLDVLLLGAPLSGCAVIARQNPPSDLDCAVWASGLGGEDLARLVDDEDAACSTLRRLR